MLNVSTFPCYTLTYSKGKREKEAISYKQQGAGGSPHHPHLQIYSALTIMWSLLLLSPRCDHCADGETPSPPLLPTSRVSATEVTVAAAVASRPCLPSPRANAGGDWGWAARPRETAGGSSARRGQRSDTQASNGFCFYHAKFGAKAH